MTPGLGPGQVDLELDRWRDGDVERAAELLHAAYPPDAARDFAPGGRLDEWQRYVATLVGEAPYGVVDREITRVVRDGDQLRALALVTFMPPASAHLAQLAIHPDCQRQGLATRLVREVQALAAASGRQELSLLVAESNRPARCLYESLGFTFASTHVA